MKVSNSVVLVLQLLEMYLHQRLDKTLKMQSLLYILVKPQYPKTNSPLELYRTGLFFSCDLQMGPRILSNERWCGWGLGAGG